MSMVKSAGNWLTSERHFSPLCMELGCQSKKSGNVRTGDRDNENSVQEFGDRVGDKHSFR